MSSKAPQTILVVDSDAAFRSFLGGLLRARGFAVVNARTGKDAVASLDRQTIAVAVVDAQTPEEGGAALVKRLRRRGFISPILFMAAGWQEHDSYRALTDELLVQRVMHKPFSAYQFIVEVESLLREKGKAVSVPPQDEAATRPRRLLSEPRIEAPISSKSSVPPSMASLAVVGADEALQNVLRRAADEAVVTLHVAADAAEVVRRFPNERIDGALLFLDPGNPDGGLAEATEILCSNIGKDLPVGFVSRSHDVELQVEAIHAGGVVYLASPIEGRHLRQAAAIMTRRSETYAPSVALVTGDGHRAELVAALEPGPVRVELRADANDLLEHLGAATPDLVLYDLDVPGVSGLDVCKLLRASPRTRALPVMLLSSHHGPEAMVAAFDAGADDFIVKPVDEEELICRVRARVSRHQAVRDSAERDPLTGVLHRHAFLDRANAMLSAARRNGNVIAFGVLRVEQGPRDSLLDDTSRNDRALSRLGSMLTERLRAYDLRARWSDEEVILALSDVEGDTARRLILRLLVDLCDALHNDPEAARLELRCRAGVAVFPDDARTIPALVRVARRRLDRAPATDVVAKD